MYIWFKGTQTHTQINVITLFHYFCYLLFGNIIRHLFTTVSSNGQFFAINPKLKIVKMKKQKKKKNRKYTPTNETVGEKKNFCFTWNIIELRDIFEKGKIKVKSLAAAHGIMSTTKHSHSIRNLVGCYICGAILPQRQCKSHKKKLRSEWQLKCFKFFSFFFLNIMQNGEAKKHIYTHNQIRSKMENFVPSYIWYSFQCCIVQFLLFVYAPFSDVIFIRSLK